MSIEEIGSYVGLFAVTLAGVRWFHRSALREVAERVKAAIYDDDSERSIFKAVTRIENDVAVIKMRADNVEKRLGLLEMSKVNE